jgi:hypothetical protein
MPGREMVMAAPANNQFWKLRSKHGRDKIFETAEILEEAVNEYFEETSQRKWTRKDWVGKDAESVTREFDTPFTLSGLYVFLAIDDATWALYRKREDFIGVVTRAEQIIRTHQIEGGMVGHFNQNLTARLNNLKEQTDLTTGGEKISPVITAMVDGQIIDGEMK